MATGTNGIATEGEAKSKLGYSGSVDTNKCCTKARAVAMGADSSKLTSYKDNQLVKYSDLYIKKQILGISCNSAPYPQGYVLYYILSEAVNYPIQVTTDADNVGTNTSTVPSGKTSYNVMIPTGNPNAPAIKSIKIAPLDKLISISILSNRFPQGYTLNYTLSEAVDYPIQVTTDDDYTGIITRTIPSGKTSHTEMIVTGNGTRAAVIKSIKISK